MKKIIMSIFCISILFVNIEPSFAQELDYLKQTMKAINGCPISHVYANKFYVPVTVKIFHDYTSQFIVGTNSSTQGAQINPDGSSNTAYLETVLNSTASFTITVFAKYADNQEHPIIVEYWSQNQPFATDQFYTVNSQFCRNIIIDTSVAPVPPDISSAVSKVVNSLLGQMISTVGSNSITLYYFLIMVTLGGIAIVILMVLFWIRLSGVDSGRTAQDEKINSMIKNLKQTTNTNESQIKFFTLEIARVVGMMHQLGEKLTRMEGSMTDRIEVAIRSAVLDIEKIYKKEEKPVEAKTEPVMESKDQVQIIARNPNEPEKEESKPEEATIPEPEKSMKDKIVDTVRTAFEKKEQPVKSQQEFYEFWSKEIDIDKVNKRYKDQLKTYEDSIAKDKIDTEVQNEVYALHMLISERNKQ